MYAVLVKDIIKMINILVLSLMNMNPEDSNIVYAVIVADLKGGVK